MKLIFFVVLALLFSSCTTASPPPPPTAAATRLPSTASPPTRSPTPAAIPTLTPTRTRTPTLTPLIVPTLPPAQAREKLMEILTNNGGCRLPCLWGITPGVSTVQDAYIHWYPLTGPTDWRTFKPKIGDVKIDFKEELTFMVNPIYLAKDNIIYQLAFRARARKDFDDAMEPRYDWDYFGEVTQFYRLPAILSEYGPPAEVYLWTFAEIPPERYGSGHFEVLLLYPDQGLSIFYKTNMNVVGKDVVGCFSNAHIDLNLTAPGDRAAFQRAYGESYQQQIENNFHPMEEVTSYTIEAFYDTFRQPENQCLATPSHFWRVAEP